eukprot:2785625-Pyramimonas_sp.AAC.1
MVVIALAVFINLRSNYKRISCKIKKGSAWVFSLVPFLPRRRLPLASREEQNVFRLPRRCHMCDISQSELASVG